MIARGLTAHRMRRLRISPHTIVLPAILTREPTANVAFERTLTPDDRVVADNRRARKSRFARRSRCVYRCGSCGRSARGCRSSYRHRSSSNPFARDRCTCSRRSRRRCRARTSPTCGIFTKFARRETRSRNHRCRRSRPLAASRGRLRCSDRATSHADASTQLSRPSLRVSRRPSRTGKQHRIHAPSDGDPGRRARAVRRTRPGIDFRRRRSTTADGSRYGPRSASTVRTAVRESPRAPPASMARARVACARRRIRDRQWRVSVSTAVARDASADAQIPIVRSERDREPTRASSIDAMPSSTTDRIVAANATAETECELGEGHYFAGLFSTIFRIDSTSGGDVRRRRIRRTDA